MKPANGTFRLEGAKDLEKVLKGLPNQVRGRTLRTAAMAGAGEIRKAARQTAPVGETGTLRASIVARQDKDSKNRHGVTVKVGPSRAGFYGLFHEFGTAALAPRPWLRPAWEAAKGRALNRIGDSLGKAIEKAARRLAGPLMKSGLVRVRGRKRGRR